MRFRVAGWHPGKSSAKQAILDGGQVSVGLDDHDELDVEPVSRLSPAPDSDDRVDDGRYRKSQIVVPHVLRATPQHQYAWKWVDKDRKRDGTVVHHAREIAYLLDRVELRRPEVAVRQQSCTSLSSISPAEEFVSQTLLTMHHRIC